VIGMVKENEKTTASCCAAARQSVDETPHARVSDSDAIEVPGAVKQPDRLRDMVFIQGDTFLMGTHDKDGFPADGEGPVREVRLDDFYMDQYAVTNQEFLTFVKATGYKTDAEKYGWSFVFEHLISDETKATVTQKVKQTPWWWVVHGADFKHPEGPDSSIDDRLDHPAIHISWHDALAYCKWSGTRLPTEAEWEYAARGGLQQKKYPWGDELTPGGEHYCNIWQGTFPDENKQDDGYFGTAPVTSFPSNGYGLFNMAGNVWEWCQDWFTKHHRQAQTTPHPRGPEQGTTKVMRGGSYLCHHSYCNRYRVAARTSNTPDSSSGNLGFRCVKDPS